MVVDIEVPAPAPAPAEGWVPVDEERAEELVVALRSRAGTLKEEDWEREEEVVVVKASLDCAPPVVVVEETEEEELRLREMRSTIATEELVRRGLVVFVVDGLEVVDCCRGSLPGVAGMLSSSSSSSSSEPRTVAGITEEVCGSSRRLDRLSRISPRLAGLRPVFVRRGFPEVVVVWGCVAGMVLSD